MTDPVTDLWRHDAVATAHLIRTGRASSREVTKSVLDRLDSVNPRLNAVVNVLAEEAMAAAAFLVRGPSARIVSWSVATSRRAVARCACTCDRFPGTAS